MVWDMRNIKIVFVRYYSSLQRKKYSMPNAMVMQSVPCAHWGCAVNHRCITLSCHNMKIKTTIGNGGFLMYKKYRCLYKHISNSIRNILKWFAEFERVVSLQSNLWKRVPHLAWYFMTWKIANRSLFPNTLPNKTRLKYNSMTYLRQHKLSYSPRVA